MMSAYIHNKVVYGPEERHIAAHLNLGKFLFDQLRKGGDNIAQICAETGTTTTFNEILHKAVNLATNLQKIGMTKGDVVAISSENRFEFTVTALAIMFCGGVMTTLNITYSTDEITHILNITKPKFVFTSPISAQNVYDCSNNFKFVEKIVLFGGYELIPALMYEKLVIGSVKVEDFVLVDVNGMEDSVAIMCSSGTTGLPKGVMLSHVNFLLLCEHMRYYIDTSVATNKHTITTFLSIIPWFHAYGLITSLAVLAKNIRVVFLVRFQEQQFLETIQKYKVNMMTIVPPLAVFLAKHPLVTKYDLSSLNEIWCGAAPLSSDVQQSVSKRVGINFIRQGYGLTEVTMACCVDLSQGDKPGSCGVPAPGMKIKVCDLESGKLLGPREEGELWIKSPLRMQGYKDDPASTAELIDADGFLRTGDIGYYDEEGYFYIVDRLKELIKYKGFQVAPAELESLILKHSGVAECGVVGKPDVAAGELPTAFIVPQPNTTLTEEEIVEFVASKISRTKWLRGGVVFVKEIPKNASGKILRRELRKLLAAGTKSKL